MTHAVVMIVAEREALSTLGGALGGALAGPPGAFSIGA